IGSILDIPVKDSCIDIITSFETLEHISDHEKAMNEFKRVLCPSGLLMISTPEKRNYSDKTGHKNPFHEKELYGNEFKTLLQKYFKEVKLFGQYSCSESVIYDPNQSNTNVFFTGDYKSVNITQMPDPVYWVAMASDNTLPAETNSSFLHLNAISELLQEQEESIKKTKSYRVGNFILYPFKRLKFLLSK
ncbi:MAG TPA: class I SAM-dependent methyltransferase, partial [Allocoleopsis sp.]